MAPSDRARSARRRGDAPTTRRRIERSVAARRRRALLASATAFLVIVGVILGITLSGSAAPAHHDHHQHVHTVATIAGPKKKKRREVVCPLTGMRAGKGAVPARPALGVKIGNDPASRPQSGLLAADIVYEEMAEGGITRYLAVFQCRQAAVVGPVRSVRWDDWHVLKSYGHPILAFSGGIDPWNEMVARTPWLHNGNASFYPMANAYYRTSNRVPPWNLYTSTQALWNLYPKDRTPPPRQFSYSGTASRSAHDAAAVTIVGFATGSNVVWKWNGSAHVWDRFYDSTPDVDASGKQLFAANVVIQMVKTRPGPYAESGTVPDTESITKGSGVAYVFRNGKVEVGKWEAPRYGDTMRLRLRNGSVMALEPGNTWVEMVPTSYAVQITR